MCEKSQGTFILISERIDSIYNRLSVSNSMAAPRRPKRSAALNFFSLLLFFFFFFIMDSVSFHKNRSTLLYVIYTLLTFFTLSLSLYLSIYISLSFSHLFLGFYTPFTTCLLSTNQYVAAGSRAGSIILWKLAEEKGHIPAALILSHPLSFFRRHARGLKLAMGHWQRGQFNLTQAAFYPPTRQFN